MGYVGFREDVAFGSESQVAIELEEIILSMHAQGGVPKIRGNANSFADKPLSIASPSLLRKNGDTFEFEVGSSGMVGIVVDGTHPKRSGRGGTPERKKMERFMLTAIAFDRLRDTLSLDEDDPSYVQSLFNDIVTGFLRSITLQGQYVLCRDRSRIREQELAWGYETFEHMKRRGDISVGHCPYRDISPALIHGIHFGGSGPDIEPEGAAPATLGCPFSNIDQVRGNGSPAIVRVDREAIEKGVVPGIVRLQKPMDVVMLGSDLFGIEGDTTDHPIIQGPHEHVPCLDILGDKHVGWVGF